MSISFPTPFFFVTAGMQVVPLAWRCLRLVGPAVRLEAIESHILEVAPNGLPSDIAPWLAFLYRRREKELEKLFEEFREILYKLFAKAEATYVVGKTENFTHAMIAAREEAIREEKGDAQYLTKGNMVQVVMNIFLAATDTSAGELHWLLLRLAKEPSIQEKIQKEIEDTIGSTPPVYDDRDRLPYTVACLLETLRFRPIAPLGVPHKATIETKVGDVVIPKDTGILYNVYGVNHDPRMWENPEEFRPERFLDSTTGKLRQDVQPSVNLRHGSTNMSRREAGKSGHVLHHCATHAETKLQRAREAIGCDHQRLWLQHVPAARKAEHCAHKKELGFSRPLALIVFEYQHKV
ncbi:hypothetical protein MTO96_004351 [Rhipicephalus appendiculatus]